MRNGSYGSITQRTVILPWRYWAFVCKWSVNFPWREAWTGVPCFSALCFTSREGCRADFSRVSLAAMVHSFAFPENMKISGNWAANWPQTQEWNVLGLGGLLLPLHNPSPHHRSGKCDMFVRASLLNWNTDVSDTMCSVCVCWLLSSYEWAVSVSALKSFTKNGKVMTLTYKIDNMCKVTEGIHGCIHVRWCCDHC